MDHLECGWPSKHSSTSLSCATRSLAADEFEIAFSKQETLLLHHRL